MPIRRPATTTSKSLLQPAPIPARAPWPGPMPGSRPSTISCSARSSSPAAGPSPRPLPQLNAGAPHGQGGPTAFRVAEARLGADWLGLPANDVKLVAPLAPRLQGGRFLPTAAPPPGMLQQMWRDPAKAMELKDVKPGQGL